jgi:hypothetical protein
VISVSYLAGRSTSGALLAGVYQANPKNAVVRSRCHPMNGLTDTTKVSVAQLLIPVGSASLRGEVEQVPQRLNGADAAGALPRTEWRVEQLRALEVADRVPITVEHVSIGCCY